MTSSSAAGSGFDNILTTRRLLNGLRRWLPGTGLSIAVLVILIFFPPMLPDYVDGGHEVSLEIERFGDDAAFAQRSESPGTRIGSIHEHLSADFSIDGRRSIVAHKPDRNKRLARFGMAWFLVELISLPPTAVLFMNDMLWRCSRSLCAHMISFSAVTTGRFTPGLEMLFMTLTRIVKVQSIVANRVRLRTTKFVACIAIVGKGISQNHLTQSVIWRSFSAQKGFEL